MAARSFTGRQHTNVSYFVVEAMFVLPINTDAPIRHFPWGTVTLISANTLVYVAAAFGLFRPDPYLLTYGEGIHPHQWLTSLFLHGGFLHLLGNMFFLWGFGIVVEGKVGIGKFLAIFLSLGIVSSAIEQICLQNVSGDSLGASAAIYGVMVIALLWAPKNEMTFAYCIPIITLFQIGTFELSILTFASLLLSIEVLTTWWFDFHLGSAVLHLIGGLLGVGLGITMLRQNWVDCEGWDLLSVMTGKTTQSLDPYRSSAPAYSKTDREKRLHRERFRNRLAGNSRTSGAQRSVRATEIRIRQLLAEGKPRAALRILNDCRHLKPDFELAKKELSELTQGLLQAGLWQEAVPLLTEYVHRFDDSIHVRVQTATILLSKMQRPVAALRMLEPLDPRQLSSPLRKRCREVSKVAHDLIDSGVLELSGQSI
ncbi:MAG: rhomboid family intramembrane serine protease [Planctomycetaceae bacterium]|nr:rhomboid family intramembrane serine protease [Planctomycetaceae bacterium]